MSLESGTDFVSVSTLEPQYHGDETALVCSNAILHKLYNKKFVMSWGNM